MPALLAFLDWHVTWQDPVALAACTAVLVLGVRGLRRGARSGCGGGGCGAGCPAAAASTADFEQRLARTAASAPSARAPRRPLPRRALPSPTTAPRPPRPPR